MSRDLDEFLRLCLIILFSFKNKNKILYIIHAYQLPLIMRAYFNENQNRNQEVQELNKHLKIVYSCSVVIDDYLLLFQ